MKKSFWFVVNFGVSSLFIWLALRGISYEELSRAFTGVSFSLVVTSLMLNLLSCWLRAVRWQLLLRPVQELSMHRVFSALMIGFMVNNILPFRLGEFARGLALKNSDGVSFSSAFGTVVVERILDVMFLLIVFAGLLLWFPFPEWVRAGGVLIGSLIVVSSAFLWLLVQRQETAMRLLSKMLRPVGPRVQQRVESVARSFVDGIRFTHSAKAYVGIFLSSALIWLSYILVVHTMMMACNFDRSGLGVWDSTVVMVFTSFAIMIPAAPGYVGTFHEIAKQSLIGLGIGREPALAWAILFHAAHYVLITGVGFVYFLGNRFKLGQALESVSPSAT